MALIFITKELLESYPEQKNEIFSLFTFYEKISEREIRTIPLLTEELYRVKGPKLPDEDIIGSILFTRDEETGKISIERWIPDSELIE